MDKKEVGYLFQVTQQLKQDLSINISGNFAKGATSQEMSTELDRCLEALAIQSLKRMKIPAVQDALEQQKERLTEEKAKLAQLQAKPRLVGAEQHNVKGLQEVIAKLEEVIPKGEEHLAELQEELKKAA
jgi:chromosome segregation ATPase